MLKIGWEACSKPTLLIFHALFQYFYFWLRTRKWLLVIRLLQLIQNYSTNIKFITPLKETQTYIADLVLKKKGDEPLSEENSLRIPIFDTNIVKRRSRNSLSSSHFTCNFIKWKWNKNKHCIILTDMYP